MLRSWSGFSVAGLLFSTFAWAQEAPGAPMPEEPSLGWTLLRTLVVLGLVVALAYLLLNFGLRRWMGLSLLPGGKKGLVRVVERVTVEPKRSLYVVEAAGEFLLLGASESGFHLISKLDSAQVARAQSVAPPPVSGASAPPGV
ncbi:MAG: flagellar biosynthetic protein FliO [Myxococcaceae bacterium]